MLRFFRHIRKQLMEQNKIRTYFFYAIGEILLVVIGILIALQVNNWNEDRKLERERVRLIQSIESDFETNQNRLADVVDFYDKMNQSLIRFQRLSDSDNLQLQKDSLLYYAGFAFEHMEIEPAMSAYHTAVSSGKLEMLDNKILIELFTEFLAKFANFKLHMDISGNIVYSGSIWDVRRELGTIHQICCTLDTEREYYIPDRYKLTEDEMIDLLVSQDVYAALENMHWVQWNKLRSLQEMQSITNKVLREIDAMQVQEK